MPAEAASAVVEGVSTMSRHSQIAIVFARGENRKNGNDAADLVSHTANVDDADEKNGGPNHLRAWMRYRSINGAQLADALGGNVTPGMVSDLANSKRALSAKWLRRLAPILKTTPGHLLDHDPHALPTGIAEVWLNATEDQRKQLMALAEVVVPKQASGQ